jgi:hypothetical protein
VQHITQIKFTGQIALKIINSAEIVQGIGQIGVGPDQITAQQVHFVSQLPAIAINLSKQMPHPAIAAGNAMSASAAFYRLLKNTRQLLGQKRLGNNAVEIQLCRLYGIMY